MDKTNLATNYNKSDLLSIKRKLLWFPTLRRIPTAAVLNIRRLKLQKRRKRGKRGGVTKENKQALSRSQNVNITVSPTQFHGKDARFGLINARSIKNKDTQMLLTLEDYGLDLCIITETWTNDSEKDQIWHLGTPLNTGNWKLDLVNRQQNRGGGVALAYNKLKFSVTMEWTLQNNMLEMATWKVKGSSTAFYLIGIYRPPQSILHREGNQCFIDKFTELLANISENYSNFIIMGDFNLHVNDKLNNDAAQFLDLLEMLGLHQHNHQPTHSSGNTLDLVITELFSIINVTNIQLGPFISDHCFVMGTLNTKSKKPKVTFTKFRKYKNCDIAKMLEDMHLDQLAADSSNLDLSQLLKLYQITVGKSLDLHAPLTTTKHTSVSKNKWYTDKLTSLKRDLHRIFNKWIKSKSPVDWCSYKKLRNKYWYEVDTTKKNFLKLEIECHATDSKYLFKLVNNLTGSESENPLPEGYTDITLANKFASYFLTKIEKIREALSNYMDYKTPMISGNFNFKEFQPVTRNDVNLELSRMQTKTCELDYLPTKIIKNHPEYFLDLYTCIVNKSLRDGIFPEDWKTATLRPLLKKPKLELIDKNYRPVSNLSFLSKLTERMGMKQLLNYCELNRLLPAHQSAYRKHHSCETLLVNFVNELLWNFEKSHITCAIFIDLSAAFDTVDHKILLEVLENKYHITGTALSWVKSYLEDRKFKVCINDTYSETKSLSFSVPQGSCNGPIYFNLYCSTIIEKIPKHINLNAFADDHELHKSCSPDQSAVEDNIRDLQSATHGIQDWMNENKLKMNPDKTEFQIFGSHGNLSKISCQSITIENSSIKRNKTTKYLGVLLDEELNFKSFIQKKCQTANWNILKLKRIKHLLDTDTLKTIVDALVTSHLDYCNGILGGLPRQDLNKLQIIQNRAARLILCTKDIKYDSKDCLRKLHWLPIELRIKFKIILLVHKCLINEAPLYLQNLLIVSNNVRTRSGTNYKQLIVPRVTKKTFAARSFSYLGPKYWNETPNSIRTITDTDQFKKKLKGHLFNNYFENTNDFVYY